MEALSIGVGDAGVVVSIRVGFAECRSGSTVTEFTWFRFLG